MFGVLGLAELAIVFILVMVPIGLNVWLAPSRRQPVLLWGLLGLLFPWVSTLVLLLFFRKKS